MPCPWLPVRDPDRPASPRPRGRWAPSPTGLLHAGNARTALVAWLSVRARGGAFVWRLEDLDPPRTVAGAARAGEEDLRWLGLDWDEGGRGAAGPFAPYAQSERHALYEAALTHLAAQGRLFPCRLSRKDLAELASAPHGEPTASPYPASLRPRALPARWLEEHRRALARPRGADAALRFRVHARPVTFHDLLAGERTERVDQTVGDFVLQRRDGLYAYQLAVVVDDLAMEIDEVVRGRDLLSSTARQVQLIEALGGRPPAYAHVPLMVNAAGEKLSKRDRGLTLRSLRERGVEPRMLTGYLAASLGLLPAPRPLHPRELIPLFAWDRIAREDRSLPDDLASELLRWPRDSRR